VHFSLIGDSQILKNPAAIAHLRRTLWTRKVTEHRREARHLASGKAAGRKPSQ
jgi:hypothetical protein